MGLFGTKRGNSPSPSAPSCRDLVRGKISLRKKSREKEKIESRKTSVRKNTPFSALRSQNALKTPRLRSLKYWESLSPLPRYHRGSEILGTQEKKIKTPPILRSSATTDAVGRPQRAHTKWNTTNHDITMFGVCWRRQALREGISNHEMGAKRNELEKLL